MTLTNMPESTALTVIDAEIVPATPTLASIDSETLGTYVRDGMVGVATKLVELKPYVEELWARFDRNETILGCTTRKEFCQQVLQRTPRAVRYMLEGGNFKRGETVSPAPSPLLPPSSPATAPLVGGEDDIRLEPCNREDPRYVDIREDHYITNHGQIGRQAHFLIHYKGEIAGIISGASPVYSTSVRDKFFGISNKNREKVLQGVVNNSVFRLVNHEPNLGTRVLKLFRNIVPHFWYEKYGSTVYGFETFVIETDTRKGTIYKADNWDFVGETQGATKVRNGIDKPADDWKQVPPKMVYCRWRDGFDHACSVQTPMWVRKQFAAIVPSPEVQPWKTRTINERWAAADSKAWSGNNATELVAEVVS